MLFSNSLFESSGIVTIVVFGLVTFLICRSLFQHDNPVDRGGGNHNRPPRSHQSARRQVAPAQTERRGGVESSSSSSSIARLTKAPPHMAPEKRQAAAPPPDGVVPFRQTKAATYEKKDLLASSRKERARLLSRILSLETTAPPPRRGSTILVTIRPSDVECVSLKRVLYLLGTYFNLFLVIHVTESPPKAKVAEWISKIHGEGLPMEILPQHRIVVVQSVLGRVALVRQLGNVEFALDFDPEMRTQLGRFGFKVMVYGMGGNSAGALSPLGALLAS